MLVVAFLLFDVFGGRWLGVDVCWRVLFVVTLVVVCCLVCVAWGVLFWVVVVGCVLFVMYVCCILMVLRWLFVERGVMRVCCGSLFDVR